MNNARSSNMLAFAQDRNRCPKVSLAFRCGSCTPFEGVDTRRTEDSAPNADELLCRPFSKMLPHDPCSHHSSKAYMVTCVHHRADQLPLTSSSEVSRCLISRT